MAGRTKVEISKPLPPAVIRADFKADEILAQSIQFTANETANIFAAGRDVGRMDSLELMISVAEDGLLNRFDAVKKSKAWRYMPNHKSTDDRFFQSFEEYCEIGLNRSYRRLQELSATRKLIGVSAYEKAEQMGLRQVDYNAIKALPAPDQELISQALQEDKTRDDVLGLLQELAARHAKETEALNKKLKDVQDEIPALAKRLEVVNKRREAAETEAARIAVLSPDESLADLKKKVTHQTNDTLGSIQGRLRQSLIAVRDYDTSIDQTVFMGCQVGECMAMLKQLMEEFNLPDMSSVKDRELAAEVAQWCKPFPTPAGDAS